VTPPPNRTELAPARQEKRDRTDPNPPVWSEPSGDAEKRESLSGLRGRYDEASKLVSTDEHYSNLEWILGGRRNAGLNPLAMEKATISAMALWLQDLAAEMDRRSLTSAAATDESRAAAMRALQSVALNLRDATDRFLLAFQEP
jgi:hypothetical protein